MGEECEERAEGSEGSEGMETSPKSQKIRGWYVRFGIGLFINLGEKAKWDRIHFLLVAIQETTSRLVSLDFNEECGL